MVLDLNLLFFKISVEISVNWLIFIKTNDIYAHQTQFCIQNELPMHIKKDMHG